MSKRIQSRQACKVQCANRRQHPCVPAGALIIAMIVGLSATSSALAQGPLGTGFTYQGEIKRNGALLNGSVSLDALLFDAATGGNQVGVAQTLQNVPVSRGLFTVLLNATGEFGPTAFNGQRRWLEVRLDGVSIAPRQEVTAAPYSLWSLGPWAANPSFGIHYLGGRVGIGIATPGSMLHVHNGQLAVSETHAAGQTAIFADGDFNDTGRAVIGSTSEGENRGPLSLVTNDTERLTIDAAGNVGIGTIAPQATLDVNGTIRATNFDGATPRFWAATTSFDFWAPAGGQNYVDVPGLCIHLQVSRPSVIDIMYTGTLRVPGDDTICTCIAVGSTLGTMNRVNDGLGHEFESCTGPDIWSGASNVYSMQIPAGDFYVKIQAKSPDSRNLVYPGVLRIVAYPNASLVSGSCP